MELTENLDLMDVEIAADTLLEEIAQRESEIKLAEQERDAFIAHYNEKILRAEEICERKTREARESIVFLTEELRRYAVTQISDKKRSVTLPSGTLQFRKQEPKFFYDDLSEANAKDARLIHFVKHNAYPYLKVKVEETVDWAKFKRRLTISDDGSCVSFKDTGEIIDGLRAQHLPDKFSIKLGGSSWIFPFTNSKDSSTIIIGQKTSISVGLRLTFTTRTVVKSLRAI